MRIVRVKKDYTRDTAPKEIKTAIDNATLRFRFFKTTDFIVGDALVCNTNRIR